MHQQDKHSSRQKHPDERQQIRKGDPKELGKCDKEAKSQGNCTPVHHGLGEFVGDGDVGGVRQPLGSQGAGKRHREQEQHSGDEQKGSPLRPLAWHCAVDKHDFVFAVARALHKGEYDAGDAGEDVQDGDSESAAV